jgi:hypothetical protein
MLIRARYAVPLRAHRNRGAESTGMHQGGKKAIRKSQQSPSNLKLKQIFGK